MSRTQLLSGSSNDSSSILFQHRCIMLPKAIGIVVFRMPVCRSSHAYVELRVRVGAQLPSHFFHGEFASAGRLRYPGQNSRNMIRCGFSAAGSRLTANRPCRTPFRPHPDLFLPAFVPVPSSER